MSVQGLNAEIKIYKEILSKLKGFERSRIHELDYGVNGENTLREIRLRKNELGSLVGNLQKFILNKIKSKEKYKGFAKATNNSKTTQEVKENGS